MRYKYSIFCLNPLSIYLSIKFQTISIQTNGSPLTAYVLNDYLYTENLLNSSLTINAIKSGTQLSMLKDTRRCKS